MKLKFYFLLLALLILAVWGVLFFVTIEQRGLLFYITESLLTLSLLTLIFFYRKVLKPLESIGNGMELLREQDFSSRLTRVGQAEADHIISIFNRMMDQLKEERLRLREQNHFLDLLVSASPMGVIILTFDGDVSMINKAALRFLGLASENDAKGLSLGQLTSPLAEEIARLPKDTTETIRLGDAMIYRCSRLSFIDRGFAHPFILIESLTSEVVKAEKMAYEKVIRMIAHEVNNTVAGITSTLDSVDSALENMQDTDEIREVMKVCVERSLSMSHFITNFANVVKIPQPQLSMTPINQPVQACKIFMENLCRDREVELYIDLCQNSPNVQMDALLFEQVLINIIKNAAESTQNGGKVILKTTANPPTIELIDDGKGIDKSVEAKIFSPFFSTKPNGQGIGLLFTREVLNAHQCTFSLRTYSDGLTRFQIVFNH